MIPRFFHTLNHRKAVLLFILVLLTASLVFDIKSYFSDIPQSHSEQCQSSKNDIEDLLSVSTSCTSDDHCISPSLGCPFSCVAVREDIDLTDLKRRVSSYQEQCGICIDECAVVIPKCIQGKCVVTSQQ